jgi:hypothetical protein
MVKFGEVYVGGQCSTSVWVPWPRTPRNPRGEELLHESKTLFLGIGRSRHDLVLARACREADFRRYSKLIKEANITPE